MGSDKTIPIRNTLDMMNKQKDEIVKLLEKDNIPEYKGKVALPV